MHYGMILQMKTPNLFQEMLTAIELAAPLEDLGYLRRRAYSVWDMVCSVVHNDISRTPSIERMDA